MIPAVQGALGKMDDDDKKLTIFRNKDGSPCINPDTGKNYLIGHNTDIYTNDYDDNDVMTANVNGKDTRDMFDDFAMKVFAKVEKDLNAEQEKQVEHLIALLNAPKSQSLGFKLSFRSNQNELDKVFGKNAPQVMKLLQSIEKNGKVTDKQISELEHYCERAQKKAGSKPAAKVASFLREAKKLAEAMKKEQEPSLRRTQSVSY